MCGYFTQHVSVEEIHLLVNFVAQLEGLTPRYNNLTPIEAISPTSPP